MAMSENEGQQSTSNLMRGKERQRERGRKEIRKNKRERRERAIRKADSEGRDWRWLSILLFALGNSGCCHPLVVDSLHYATGE
jgi:hypothetical protein